MDNFNKIIFYIFITITLIAGSILEVSAQDGDAGTESNLSLGYGARALGLGNAFTALADDPTAVFWNPAGLEYIEQKSVTLFHTSLWEGTNFDFLGFAYPTLNLGTFGIGIGRIGVGDIEQLDASGSPLFSTFSFEEIQAYLSYAKKLPYNLTPGITFRYLRRGWNGLQGYDDLIDSGFGADAGLMYRPDFFGNPWLQDLSFGLKVHNLFASQLKEGTEIDQLPLTIKLGALKKIRFSGGNYFNILFDLNHSQERDMRFHMGTEYHFRDIGGLRLGYNGSTLSFGAGVEYNMFQIDYAYGQSTNSDFFPPVHRVSLSINFGMNRDQLFAEAESKRWTEERALIARSLEAERQQFIRDRMQIADRYYSQQQYMDAIVEYKQVLTRDSLNYHAKSMLDSSNTRLQEGFESRQNQAIQAALDQSKVQEDQNFVNQHFESGRKYLNQNRFSEALLEFNLALERDPQNATLRNAIQTTTRRISEEINRLIRQSRSEMENENYADAQVLLNSAQDLSQNNRARLSEINALNTEIELRKTLQRGTILFQLGEFEEASKVFNEILASNPDNTVAKEYYDKCRIELTQTDQEMDDDTKKRYLKGVNEFVRGNYDQAISIWDSILIEQPYNKTVRKALDNAKERASIDTK